ncbi:CidA/LrgA family protein [Staphylococcus lloydii]|uniref:CidA/LrgA family protein n=1 Tax=Staphylococcus lloydii TaxID=2781774 RepID=UPI002927C0BC|nr:CidA/LrgA family protein [Staphylococcus lloydii]MDU9418436.1 CidA/LrgA family protein [Staphylococcus lloydii]
MQLALKVVKIIIQIAVISGITYLGNVLQQALHIPIAGSIVGLALFFVLLQFKIIPEKLIKEGANFLLATMVFFFVPSVVGIMDIASNINLNYIVFFLLVIAGTCSVALISGYIAEKMFKTSDGNSGSH